MKAVETERLILRPFREPDYNDLFAFLSQLEADPFEPCPGITRENGVKYLQERVGSEEYYAMELKGSGRVIGNIYLGNRDFGAKRISGGTSGFSKTRPARRCGKIPSYTRCCRKISRRCRKKTAFRKRLPVFFDKTAKTSSADVKEVFPLTAEAACSIIGTSDVFI